MEDVLEKIGQFLKLCKKATHNDTEVIHLVKKRFKNAQESFLTSERFSKLLAETTDKIKSDRSNTFVHLKAFLSPLKSHDNKRRKRLKYSDSDSSQPDAKRPKTEKFITESSGVGSDVSSPPTTCCIPKDIPDTVREGDNSSVEPPIPSASNEEVSRILDSERPLTVVLVGKTKNKHNAEGSSSVKILSLGASDLVENTVKKTSVEKNNLSIDDVSKSSDYHEETVKEDKKTTISGQHDSLSRDEVNLPNEKAVVSLGDKDLQHKVDKPKRIQTEYIEEIKSGKYNSEKADSPDVEIVSEYVLSESTSKGNVPLEAKTVKDETVVRPEDSGTDQVPVSDSLASDHEDPTQHVAEAEVGEDGELSTQAKQSPNNPDQRKCSKRQLKRLEDLLEKISSEIQRLEERELSLDELEDDSAYTLEDRYKKKFVKVWNKICQVTGRPPTTGRATERKFKFEGTRYPEINIKVEKFVTRNQDFPDYQDILDIIKKCNQKYHLRISPKSQDSMARDVFLTVGNELQKRRMLDFTENISSTLKEPPRLTNDPALFDAALRSKFESSKKFYKTKMDQVLEKYAHRQENYSESSSEDDEEEDEENEEPTDADLHIKGESDVDLEASGSTLGQDGKEGNEETKGSEKKSIDAEDDDCIPYLDNTEFDIVPESTEEESNTTDGDLASEGSLDDQNTASDIISTEALGTRDGWLACVQITDICSKAGEYYNVFNQSNGSSKDKNQVGDKEDEMEETLEQETISENVEPYDGEKTVLSSEAIGYNEKRTISGLPKEAEKVHSQLSDSAQDKNRANDEVMEEFCGKPTVVIENLEQPCDEQETVLFSEVIGKDKKQNAFGLTKGDEKVHYVRVMSADGDETENIDTLNTGPETEEQDAVQEISSGENETEVDEKVRYVALSVDSRTDQDDGSLGDEGDYSCKIIDVDLENPSSVGVESVVDVESQSQDGVEAVVPNGTLDKEKVGTRDSPMDVQAGAGKIEEVLELSESVYSINKETDHQTKDSAKIAELKTGNSENNSRPLKGDTCTVKRDACTVEGDVGIVQGDKPKVNDMDTHESIALADQEPKKEDSERTTEKTLAVGTNDVDVTESAKKRKIIADIMEKYIPNKFQKTAETITNIMKKYHPSKTQDMTETEKEGREPGVSKNSEAGKTSVETVPLTSVKECTKEADNKQKNLSLTPTPELGKKLEGTSPEKASQQTRTEMAGIKESEVEKVPKVSTSPKTTKSKMNGESLDGLSPRKRPGNGKGTDTKPRNAQLEVSVDGATNDSASVICIDDDQSDNDTDRSDVIDLTSPTNKGPEKKLPSEKIKSTLKSLAKEDTWAGQIISKALQGVMQKDQIKKANSQDNKLKAATKPIENKSVPGASIPEAAKTQVASQKQPPPSVKPQARRRLDMNTSERKGLADTSLIPSSTDFERGLSKNISRDLGHTSTPCIKKALERGVHLNPGGDQRINLPQAPTLSKPRQATSNRGNPQVGVSSSDSVLKGITPMSSTGKPLETVSGRALGSLTLKSSLTSSGQAPNNRTQTSTTAPSSTVARQSAFDLPPEVNMAITNAILNSNRPPATLPHRGGINNPSQRKNYFPGQMSKPNQPNHPTGQMPGQMRNSNQAHQPTGQMPGQMRNSNQAHQPTGQMPGQMRNSNQAHQPTGQMPGQMRNSNRANQPTGQRPGQMHKANHPALLSSLNNQVVGRTTQPTGQRNTPLGQMSQPSYGTNKSGGRSFIPPGHGAQGTLRTNQNHSGTNRGMLRANQPPAPTQRRPVTGNTGATRGELPNPPMVNRLLLGSRVNPQGMTGRQYAGVPRQRERSKSQTARTKMPTKTYETVVLSDSD